MTVTARDAECVRGGRFPGNADRINSVDGDLCVVQSILRYDNIDLSFFNLSARRCIPRGKCRRRGDVVVCGKSQGKNASDAVVGKNRIGIRRIVIEIEIGHDADDGIIRKIESRPICI